MLKFVKWSMTKKNEKNEKNEKIAHTSTATRCKNIELL